MSSLDLTYDQLTQFNALDQFFEENKSALTKILTFDNLTNEAHALNTIESNIPEKARLDLHINLILNKETSNYYKSMSNGKNSILEAARKVFPNSKQITESIESFKEYLMTLINENDLALAMPTGIGVPTAPLVPRTGGGFWSVLKKLWNAVTEGGSVIGIIQFIIDIIGLVGDFIIPGVGVVADILNAIIYAIRGMWIPCAISLIAAFVIGAGDSFKLLKAFAAPAEKIMGKLAVRGGAETAAQTLSKISAKERGPILKLLTAIAGNVSGVMGKATSMLGKFWKGFGKVTGYIPGLGKVLDPIFSGMGKVLSQFGEKMSLFSSNLKILKKGAVEAAEASIDSAVKAGGDFIFEGPWIKVVNKEGRTIAKYPAKKLEELMAKKAGSKKGAQILYGGAGQAARVNRTLKNKKVHATLTNRFKKYFKTVGVKRINPKSRFIMDLPGFIGKQIYKTAFGRDWIDGQSNWSRDEVEGHGNGALNDWINDKISKEKLESGASYLPYTELDSQDQESLEHISDYQNHLAKEYGQPTIMSVVSNNIDKEKVSDEFDDFFNAIAEGKVKRGEKGDQTAHSLDTDQGIDDQSQFESRTIFNFSDFKG